MESFIKANQDGGAWDIFVDVVTFIWLGVFVSDIAMSLGDASGVVLLSLLPIYVADLGVQYRRVGNLRGFLRKHWLTILMTIPYLRVLRLLRLARLLRTLRLFRIVRVGKWVQKIEGARRKVERLQS